MKWKMKNLCILLVVLVLLFQTACSKAGSTSSYTNSDSSATTVSGTTTGALAADPLAVKTSTSSKPKSDTSPASKNKKETGIFLKPYDDIRAFDEVKIFKKNEYDAKDIITFTFNKGTVLKGSEKRQAEIMKNGKNPGLGIRELHKKGITGKGINVAIIDQNLLLHHPEFDGKIAKYYDTGCEQDPNSGSMHAPAVTSILVGNKIGVAPDAKVYFAAAPSWKGDSEYYAKGLYWIIEENKKLPEGKKIRVVSVSAAPSGKGSPFTKNLKMWDEAVLAAQDDGILVLDCRNTETTGIIAPAFYNPEKPDNISMCTGGFPTSKYVVPSTQIGVPTSYRTVAEEYREGSPSYQYTGQGGLSWGIPYATGVLALGWQVNPALDKDQMVQILFKTCSTANDGSNIINPAAFIDAVKKTKK
ncbi:S8 family serine peptidase [Anaerocolumna jejuensis]|uniref:S8 family serine peptidase n=1 Tax=Anaerocolumna jejuensis TaxID=259063 RepID=UPI003F7B6E90